MKQFRIGSPDRIEESTDGGHTWHVDWELTPDRASVIARQTCSQWSACKASVSDLEFFPGMSGALAVAIDLPAIAVRPPGGTWSLVGSWRYSNNPRFATFDSEAIVPEIELILVVCLFLLLVFRVKMGDSVSAPTSLTRVIALAIAFFPAVSVVLLIGIFLALGAADLPARVVAPGRAMEAASVILYIIHASRPLRGRLADFAMLVGAAAAAWLVAVPGPFYSLLLISVVGAIGLLSSSIITKAEPEKRKQEIIVGKAALLLPLVGIAPFFLWSGGIVPRYWAAATIAAGGMVVVAVEAWNALHRAVDGEPGGPVV